MTWCLVRTCHLRGEHRTECEIPCARARCAGPREHEDACHGCRPAEATYGCLCERDRGRLARALVTAGDLVRHLRDEVPPTSAPSDGQPRGHRAPPAPLRLDAVDDADQVYAALADLADAVAAAQRLTGPRRPGVWVDETGRILGVRPEHAAEAAYAVAGWLHTHLDWISGWAVVPELFEAADVVELVSGATYKTPAGLVRLVETIAARWPTASRERPIPGVICPRCDTRGSLIYWPPAEYEAPVTVACARCGYIVPDDQHGWYARLTADVARTEGATVPTQREGRQVAPRP